MEEVKYLYGAAVQGIQGFLLQTNVLKDIVGASELVDEICTRAFKDFAAGDNGKPIVMAAGNIKYIFNNEEACKKAVREFPMHVQQMAPGITISQAVVKMEGEYSEFSKAVNELESRLRAQRNKVERSTSLGLIGIRRSRQTGLPVTEKRGSEYLDEGTSRKLYAAIGHGKSENITYKLCEKSFGERFDEPKSRARICLNITEMTKDNDWLAVIHADGNGLGLVVQKIGGDPEQLSEFSQNLDLATREAAQEAYRSIKNNWGDSDKIPLRPIVLSGDDLTIICRADLAIAYTTAFIKAFENRTKEHLGKILTREPQNPIFAGGENYLTACAGITFIKSSYPYYYAYDLAEQLCSEAKKVAKASIDVTKELPASCLMFHKVQDSFIESYNDIVERELTANAKNRFNFGPYYIEKIPAKSQGWTISKLEKALKKLDLGKYKGLKNQLRQWISIMHENTSKADQLLRRIAEIYGKNDPKPEYKELIEYIQNDKGVKHYPTYDILSLYSISNVVTKTSK